MAAAGTPSAPPRIQKRQAGDPIATRARLVADLPPRSGWLGLRPAIADTVGSPGPDAGASCTGRGALAKHGPAGPTPWLEITAQFFPCEATSFIEDRLAECQPVAKGHCGRSEAQGTGSRVRLRLYGYIFLDNH